jgi:hypothetical protein
VSVGGVILICGCAVAIEVHFDTVGATEHPIVENIVAIILGSNVFQKFTKHRHEQSKFLWHVLKVGLDTNVRDTIRRLIVVIYFDVANHLDFRVSKANFSWDII